MVKLQDSTSPLTSNKQPHKEEKKRREEKRAVVLAGDYGYIRQIETTLKSLIFHNSHLKIYIFNQDIPKEWFIHYKSLLNQICSDLIDIKLLDVPLNRDWYAGFSHITYMAFARYFIPQFVSEDKVLYLDSDIIITDSLDNLFTIDISQHYLAVVRATFGYGLGFNSGMMLINNKRWKTENITTKLVEKTEQEKDSIQEGDQTILNLVLGHEAIWLDDTYNFQIGFDQGAFSYRHQHLFELSLDPLPKILHYISGDKPWNTYSSGRLREVWWHYHFLAWTDILKKWENIQTMIPKKHCKGKLLIITNTHWLQNIEYLVKQLPDYEFHITAFTDVANNLKQLSSQENVFIYPHIIAYVLVDMIKNCDIYLDINHGSKLDELLEHVIVNQKPVLSFDNIAAPIFENYSHRQVFSYHLPENFVTAVRLLSE
ncbi:TPA: glycosyl hydrolase family 8 [Streptococcus suis]|nr:glycosyl hydrolase family 8 [Streptococcus suis]HEM4557418.1 glycosyl hydrolase family 8 [Streptococcus suis]HEM4609864.1 glycosyl hydrolase family 8 [Streptococcus suis]